MATKRERPELTKAADLVARLTARKARAQAKVDAVERELEAARQRVIALAGGQG